MPNGKGHYRARWLHALDARKFASREPPDSTKNAERFDAIHTLNKRVVRHDDRSMIKAYGASWTLPGREILRLYNRVHRLRPNLLDR